MDTPQTRHFAHNLGPWEGAKAYLLTASAPLVTEFTEYREGHRLVQLAEVYFPAAPYRGRSTRAFGYCAWPKNSAREREVRCPAMLLLHGGGGGADARWARWWARRGYVALAVDLAGQGPGRQRLPNGGPAFSSDTFLLTYGLENTWMYHAVATSLAGVSALSSLPTVDPERIGVTGISWGGYFCATVMSIDARVRLGIPMYGCGFNSRVANGADPTFEDGRLQREAFDPSNFLHQCRKPVLWITTTHDNSTPLNELQRSLHATAGPSTLCLTVNPGHTDPRAIGSGQRPEAEYFVDHLFLSGEPLVSLGPPQLDGRTLRASVGPGTPATRAALHYTAELDKPWHEREWRSEHAACDDDAIYADLPSDSPRLVAFFNACDEREATVASDWIETGV